MNEQVIDLAGERIKRDRPDPDCVKQDQHGTDMFLFSLVYHMDDKTWGISIWAYSWDDAEARVSAMRQSLEVSGQTYAVIPL